MRPTFEQMTAFVCAVDNGSFSAAARALKKDRTTLSQVISNFEIDLGYEIFDRSGAKPILNKEGRVLYEYARPIVRQLENFSRIARNIGDGIEASITIYHDATLPPDLIAQVNRELFIQFPEVAIHWLYRNREEMLEALVNGSAQIGIMMQGTGNDLYINFCQLTSFSYHAITAPHSIVPKTVQRPSDLSAFPQLVLENVQESNLTRKLQFSPDMRIYTSIEALTYALKGGCGWTILPYHSVSQLMENGELLEVKIQSLSTPQVIPCCMYWPQDRQPGPVAQVAMTLIQDAMIHLSEKFSMPALMTEC